MNDLIISDHALLRAYENGLSEDRIQCLWKKARKTKDNIYRLQYKLSKYGDKQLSVEYFRSKSFLLTVDTKDNVLISIFRKKFKNLKP